MRGLSFNGVFSALKDHFGEDAARATDTQGKGSRASFLAYPVADFLTVAWNAADALEGTFLTVESAFHEMGRRGARNLFESLAGRTLLSLADGDPRLLAVHLGTGYRGAVSYGQRRVEWTGLRSCRIRFERDFLVPHYHCGVLSTALEFMGAKHVEVQGRQVRLLDAEYEVTWE